MSAQLHSVVAEYAMTSHTALPEADFAVVSWAYRLAKDATVRMLVCNVCVAYEKRQHYPMRM